jgi:serine/threonine-protein kinase
MAYEMLTGAPPFTGATPQSVLAAHMTRQPEPIASRRAAVPALSAAIVMRCLEKNPADRWQSVTDLLAQLDAMSTPGGGMLPLSPADHAGAGHAGPMRNRIWRSSRTRGSSGVAGYALRTAVQPAGRSHAPRWSSSSLREPRRA